MINLGLSPSARSNLALAAIPLGLAIIARGLDELHELMAARWAELADLEARISGARAQLFAMTGDMATGNMASPASGKEHTDRPPAGDPVTVRPDTDNTGEPCATCGATVTGGDGLCYHEAAAVP